MERWTREWVENVIELLHDPYGDYDRMRKELEKGVFWSNFEKFWKEKTRRRKIG